MNNNSLFLTENNLSITDSIIEFKRIGVSKAILNKIRLNCNIKNTYNADSNDTNNNTMNTNYIMSNANINTNNRNHSQVSMNPRDISSNDYLILLENISQELNNTISNITTNEDNIIIRLEYNKNNDSKSKTPHLSLIDTFDDEDSYTKIILVKSNIRKYRVISNSDNIITSAEFLYSVPSSLSNNNDMNHLEIKAIIAKFNNNFTILSHNKYLIYNIDDKKIMILGIDIDKNSKNSINYDTSNTNSVVLNKLKEEMILRSVLLVTDQNTRESFKTNKVNKDFSDLLLLYQYRNKFYLRSSDVYFEFNYNERNNYSNSNIKQHYDYLLNQFNSYSELIRSSRFNIKKPLFENFSCIIDYYSGNSGKEEDDFKLFFLDKRVYLITISTYNNKTITTKTTISNNIISKKRESKLITIHNSISIDFIQNPILLIKKAKASNSINNNNSIFTKSNSNSASINSNSNIEIIINSNTNNKTTNNTMSNYYYKINLINNTNSSNNNIYTDLLLSSKTYSLNFNKTRYLNIIEEIKILLYVNLVLLNKRIPDMNENWFLTITTENNINLFIENTSNYLNSSNFEYFVNSNFQDVKLLFLFLISFLIDNSKIFDRMLSILDEFYNRNDKLIREQDDKREYSSRNKKTNRDCRFKYDSKDSRGCCNTDCSCCFDKELFNCRFEISVIQFYFIHCFYSTVYYIFKECEVFDNTKNTKKSNTSNTSTERFNDCSESKKLFLERMLRYIKNSSYFSKRFSSNSLSSKIINNNSNKDISNSNFYNQVKKEYKETIEFNNFNQMMININSDFKSLLTSIN